MLRFLVRLGVGLALPIVAVVFLAAQALEERPLVDRADELSPSSIARALEILRRNDPRKLARNATREVSLAGPDLEALLNFATRRGIAQGHAALQLRQGGAEIRYTAPLPAPYSSIARMLGLGGFLNLSAQLGVAGKTLEVEQAHLGRLPLPPALVKTLADAYFKRSDLQREVDLLDRTISSIVITPEDVRLTYVWQPELLASARALAISPAQRDRLAAAHRRLTDAIDQVAQTRRSAPLAEILVPLLQASAGSDAYRDVLLATALHLSGKNIALLIPDAARWPRPRPLTLTLRDRGDLAQHFAISAAIAAWAGEPLASAVGLDKELDDSRDGSGFSFVDLAADRAGTRLGELAARNPRRLAAALAAGLDDAALLPPVGDLPESMKADEFRRRFGGPDAPAYRRMSDEIDRRLDALALFR